MVTNLARMVCIKLMIRTSLNDICTKLGSMLIRQKRGARWCVESFTMKSCWQGTIESIAAWHESAPTDGRCIRRCCQWCCTTSVPERCGRLVLGKALWRGNVAYSQAGILWLDLWDWLQWDRCTGSGNKNIALCDSCPASSATAACLQLRAQ